MKETHSVYHTGKRKKEGPTGKGKGVALLIPNKLTPYISNIDSEVGRLISIDISPPINKVMETQTHYRVVNLYLPASDEQKDKEDRLKIKKKLEN